jgi:tripartite-type tricarboxylate transporter receptor subunit TctC
MESSFDVTRREVLASLVALAALAGMATAGAGAQAPRRLIVPAGPGSVPDVRARWLAERLGAALGEAIVVENHPGAGGTLAMDFVARSAPDGRTMVFVHSGLMVFNPLLLAKPGYEPEAFRLVTRVGVGPLLLLVPPTSPLGSVSDLVARGRTNPTPLSHASQGLGTPPHLAAELLMQQGAFRSQHVPYTVPTQPIADLIGGHIDWMLEGTPVALPLVRTGRLRALAVTADTRLPELPEVPTIGEAGLPGARFEGWTGLAMRAATPRAEFMRVADATTALLRGDEALRWFREVGNVPGGESPDAAAALLRDELVRWDRVIRAAGLVPAR